MVKGVSRPVHVFELSTLQHLQTLPNVAEVIRKYFGSKSGKRRWLTDQLECSC